MKLSRTWIDTTLTREEIEKLVDWLMERSANPTSKLIREGLVEIVGVDEKDLPSLNSVNEWRNKSLPPLLHIREMTEDAKVAKVLAEASQGDFAQANRELAEYTLFDQLRALREGRRDDVDVDGLVALMRGVSSLAKIKRDDSVLELKLKEYEAKEAERQKAAENLKNESLTPTEREQKLKEIFGLK